MSDDPNATEQCEGIAIERNNNDSSQSSSKRNIDEESPKEDGTEPPYKRQRFEAVAEEDNNMYELPEELAAYVNKYLERFVPDKGLKDSILYENPVPSNVIKPKRLDDFFKELLEEQKKRSEMALDDALEKIQQKTLNILGPLSKVWLVIEGAIASSDDRTEIQLEDLAKHLEQTVMLIGQTFNALTYNRRLNALSVIMSDKRKAKNTIKEQSSLLEKTDANLFGSSFRKHVIETAKAKKESKEVYKHESKRPFRKGPSFQQKHNGGRTAVFTKTQTQRGGMYDASRSSEGQFKRYNGKQDSEIRTLPQHDLSGKKSVRNTRDNSVESVKPRTSIAKKFVFKSGVKKIATCRKTAVLCKKLAKINKRTQHIRVDFRSKNRIYETASAEKPTTSGENECRTNFPCETRNRDHVEERGCTFSSVSERGISKQYIFSQQKGWREQTSDKFEKSEYLHPVSAFQNGGAEPAERVVAAERLHVQS